MNNSKRIFVIILVTLTFSGNLTFAQTEGATPVSDGAAFNIKSWYLTNWHLADPDKYLKIRTSIPFTNSMMMSSIQLDYWGYNQNWQITVGWYSYGTPTVVFHNPTVDIQGMYDFDHVYLATEVVGANTFVTILIPNSGISQYGNLSAHSLTGATNTLPTTWKDNWLATVGVEHTTQTNLKQLLIANRISTDGNIGIGITEPQHKLQIYSTDNPTLAIGKLNTHTNGKSTLQFYAATGSGGNGYKLEYNKAGATDYLTFIDGGLREVLTLKNGGDIGINTSSPTSRLHVLQSSETNWGGYFQNTNGNGSGLKIRAGDGSGSNTTQALLVEDNSGSIPRFVVQTNGAVGIGTNPPENSIYKLEAAGNVRANTGNDGGFYLTSSNSEASGMFRQNGNNVAFKAGGAEAMSLTSGGLVGIGTASPTNKLHVVGNQLLEGYRTLNLSSSGGTISFNGDAGGWAMGSYVKGSGGTNYGGFGFQGSADDLLNYFIGTYTDKKVTVLANGNVGVGTDTPGSYKLAVEGMIGARSVKVTGATWADYVFAPTYKLMSLPATEEYIQENGHLPNVPAASEIENNGFVLEEMDAKLMEKIEELTLHLIEQNKRLQEQQKEIEALKKSLLEKN